MLHMLDVFVTQPWVRCNTVRKCLSFEVVGPTALCPALRHNAAEKVLPQTHAASAVPRRQNDHRNVGDTHVARLDVDATDDF